MVDLVMQYTNHDCDTVCVLIEECTNFIIVNTNKSKVFYWGEMASWFDVFEDVDIECNIYVRCLEDMKKWLLDNQEYLIFNVDDIMKNMYEM